MSRTRSVEPAPCGATIRRSVWSEKLPDAAYGLVVHTVTQPASPTRPAAGTAPATSATRHAIQRAARPDYAIGCKRVLITSDWLPTLARPHVDLVTAPIAEVVPEGVRSADGVVHEADLIIFGTGFTATDFLAPMEVVGRGGASLRETWAGGAQAYFGLTVPRFPNMFVMYGPNTGHGTGSAVDMLEAQAGYLAQAIGALASGAAERLEVREGVHAAFQAEIAERMTSTVWASGCGSWYVNDRGRVTATWPGPPAEYLRRTARLDLGDYETRVVGEPVAAG